MLVPWVEPLSPPTDDQLTIEPPPLSSMARMPYFMPSSTPRRSTSRILSYSAIVTSATEPPLPMPATLSRMSTRPNVSTAACTIAATSSSRVTSTWQGTTASPSSDAVSFSAPLMSAASTLAPSRTKHRADALAMPDPAPVMTATLPSSWPIVFPL